MPGVDSYDELFAATAPTGPDWLRRMREEGVEAFRDQGFPTLRNESWRFTRVRPIQEKDFNAVAEYHSNGFTIEKLHELTFDDSGCDRIVIIDGHYAPDLSSVGSLPDGARVMNLAQAIEETPEDVEAYLGRYADIAANPFVALNSAFIKDGVFIGLADGVALERPIHVAFVATSTGTVVHPRMLVVAGRNSEASIIESWSATGDAYFSNPVSEIHCGANAGIHHCKLQHESRTAMHVSTQASWIERDARFSTENVSIGGQLVRNDINSHLGGEGIDCRVDGLYLARGRQHVDNHTFIRHASPKCHSFELYKGILGGSARGVFNGKIYVDPHAQKTDAKQSNNCILLSDDARLNTNPQLEIFADDVKCTHGATIGQLDENAVYYLRSRGIAEEKARHMLIHAFASEVIERVKVGRVREQLEVELFWWLSRAMTH